MTAALSKDRGHFWPFLFALIGGLNIADYFYKFSYQTDDLLQGLGFLFMVPLSYFYPSAYRFKKTMVRVRPAPWAKWLSLLGLLLVAAGFVVQWL